MVAARYFAYVWKNKRKFSHGGIGEVCTKFHGKSSQSTVPKSLAYLDDASAKDRNSTLAEITQVVIANIQQFFRSRYNYHTPRSEVSGTSTLPAPRPNSCEQSLTTVLYQEIIIILEILFNLSGFMQKHMVTHFNNIYSPINANPSTNMLNY